MKTIVSGLLVIFSFGQLWAQYSIKVEEDKQKIADGNHSCLVVSIYQSTPGDVSDAWAKLMKSYDAKVTSRKEIFANNALIKDLSDKVVDIYARCEKKSDDELELIVAVDLGGAFLNSSDHTAQVKVMKKILKEFAKQATLDGLNDKIKDQDKVCQKRQKELDGLVKDKAKLEKDIEYYKKKITQDEDDINQNIKDQGAKQKEIDSEKQKFDELGKFKNKVD